MSARTKLIVAGVIALIVCVIFYMFFIRPRAAELDRTNDEISTAQAETTALRAQLTDLEELRENAPRLQAELNEFRDLVPRRDDTANFIFQMQDAAVASGVGFVQIDPEEPKPPPEGAALAQVRATIGAKGGYFSIQDFIRRINELDRAVGIDSINMVSTEEEEGAEERGRIDLTMTIRIFFEIPEVQAPVTAPGEAPATTETPAPGTETPAPGTTPEAGTAPEAGTTPAETAG